MSNDPFGPTLLSVSPPIFKGRYSLTFADGLKLTYDIDSTGGSVLYDPLLPGLAIEYPDGRVVQLEPIDPEAVA